MDPHNESPTPIFQLMTNPSSGADFLSEPHHQQSLSRLAVFFPEGSGLITRFTDSDIYQITTLLQENRQNGWSKVPRLYIVLRKIGHLPLLDGLIDQGVNDYWFPFDSRSIQHLQKSAQADFLVAQESIMTTGLNLEKGIGDRHYHFKGQDTIPFDIGETLGKGATSKVDRIVSHISRREYARKTFKRQKGPSKVEIQAFMNELRILKRIRHHHCVELIASYTDARLFGIIMSPVADCNLRSFYSKGDVPKAVLRTFFGCLSGAVSYLHSLKIRHRDIKPENILVRGDHVYLADFGISLDWENLTRSTTVADSGKTLAYCAPEVANDQKRNTSSDIWSLGCVFLEICTVLKDLSLDQMRHYFKQRTESWAFYKNLPYIKEWIDNLKASPCELDNRPLRQVESMLQTDTTCRPSAQELYQHFKETGSIPGSEASSFCASCCFLDDQASSEAETDSDSDLWLDEEATSPQLTDNVVKTKHRVSNHSHDPSLVVEHPSSDDSHGLLSSLKTHSLDSGILPRDTVSPLEEVSDSVERNQSSPTQHPGSVSHLGPLPRDRQQPYKAFRATPAQLPKESGQVQDLPWKQHDKDRSMDQMPANQQVRPDQPPAPKSLVPKPGQIGAEVGNRGPAARPWTDSEGLEVSFAKSAPVTAVVQLSDSEALADSAQKRSFPESLPKLSSQDWNTPARLMLAIYEDCNFMKSLSECRPDLYEGLCQSQTAILSELVACLIKAGLDVNHESYQDERLGGPMCHVLRWSKQTEFRSLFRLMIEKVNFARQESYFHSAFTWAAYYGHYWAVTDLIDSKVPKPSHWKSCLIGGAIDRGDLLVTKHLYTIGVFTLSDSTDRDIMSLAIFFDKGHKETAEWALQKDETFLADTQNGQTPFQYACSHGHAEMVKLLLGRGAKILVAHNDYGMLPTKLACRGGHIDVLRILLDFAEAHQLRPFDILYKSPHKRYDISPLRTACLHNRAEVVRLLMIRQHASTKIAAPELDVIGWDELDSIHEACREGHLEIVRIFFEVSPFARGLINIRRPETRLDLIPKVDAYTALGKACEGNHLEVVRLLLKHGAAVDSRCFFIEGLDWTCLQYAADHGRTELIELLLDAGADCSLRTNRFTGKTAMKLAKSKGHQDIMRLLAAAKFERGLNKKGAESKGR